MQLVIRGKDFFSLCSRAKTCHTPRCTASDFLLSLSIYMMFKGKTNPHLRDDSKPRPALVLHVLSLVPKLREAGPHLKSPALLQLCDEGMTWAVDPALMVTGNTSRMSLLLRPQHYASEVSEFCKCWVHDWLRGREEMELHIEYVPRDGKPGLGWSHKQRWSQLCPMEASQKLGRRGRLLPRPTSRSGRGSGGRDRQGRSRCADAAVEEVDGHGVDRLQSELAGDNHLPQPGKGHSHGKGTP